MSTMIYSDIKMIFSPMTTHQQNQLKSKNLKRTVPFHKIMGTMLLRLVVRRTLSDSHLYIGRPAQDNPCSSIHSRHITTLHNRLNQSKLHQSHSLLQCQNLNRPQCQSQSIQNQLSTRSFLNQNQSRSRNRSRKNRNQFRNQKWYNKVSTRKSR